MVTTAKEDDVMDVNVNNIVMKMNKQVLEKLSPPKIRLNYN
jgi:hypothetical protein